MPDCIVDGLTFQFPDGWTPAKYDDWSFYRNRLIAIQDGIKALDILALAPDGAAWLVEAKDFRHHPRTKPTELESEVAKKVLDTLAALLPAKLNGDVYEETQIAKRVLRTPKLRVVLHLELPVHGTILRQHAIDLANVQMKLRKRLKWIDAHPIVATMERMGNLPWEVRATPAIP